MHSATMLPDEGIQQSRSTHPLRRVLIKGCSKMRRHELGLLDFLGLLDASIDVENFPADD